MLKDFKILKSIFLVSSISFFTKYIGFFREIIIAKYYGANWVTDAFFLAQNMPGLIFPSICDSFGTSFISVYLNLDKKIEKKKFLLKSLMFLILLSIFLTLLAFIILPVIVKILAPGFPMKTLKLSIILSRISMSYFSILMINTILISYLNAREKFSLSQVSWLIYNFILLLSIVIFPKDKITYLCFSYFISNFIQMIFLIKNSIKKFFNKKVFYTISHTLYDNNIKKLIRLTIPIILGNSFYQIQNIVDKILVTYGTEGYLSALSYTFSINNIVFGLCISSIMTVIYPMITKENNKIIKLKKIENIIKILLTFILPISIFTYFYANEIVKIIYFRGLFDENAIFKTSLFLKYYSIGYIFIALKELFVKIFYSLGNSKTPMKNTIISIIVNILSSIVLVMKIGVYGIAIGTVIASIISSLMLFLDFKLYFPNFCFKKQLIIFIKNILSAFISFYFFNILFLEKIKFKIDIINLFIKGILFLSFYIIILICLNYILKKIKIKIV